MSDESSTDRADFEDYRAYLDGARKSENLYADSMGSGQADCDEAKAARFTPP